MGKGILYGIVLIILSLVWVGLEYYLDGNVINQYSDTILSFIFAYLITDKIYNEYIKK